MLGMQGAEPLAKNNFGLPLPRRGRGLGGWGQKSKLKGGLAGDQPGTPPPGTGMPPNPAL